MTVAGEVFTAADTSCGYAVGLGGFSGVRIGSIRWSATTLSALQAVQRSSAQSARGNRQVHDGRPSPNLRSSATAGRFRA